jgi:hypothetical protein
MDFTKFVDLLETRSLYFCRVDLLSDRWEGSLTKTDIEERARSFEHVEEPLKQQMAVAFPTIFHQIRQTYFVNCWHLNVHESAAMWKLYLKSHEGIAVRTNLARLSESTGGEELIVGKVRYIDYASDRAFQNYESDFAFCKRASFAYENEVRALYMNHGPVVENEFGMKVEKAPTDNPLGKRISVDLDALIEEVYVAPTSPDWITDLVRAVLKRYSLSVKVCRSSLDEDPMF